MRKTFFALIIALSLLLSACAKPAAQPQNLPTPVAQIERATEILPSLPSQEAATSTPTAGELPPAPENRTIYDLDATLDYAQHTVSVVERITYTNRTDQAMNELLLLVPPRYFEGAYSQGSISGGLIGQSRENGIQTMLSLEPARFHGWLATELAPLNTPFSLSGLGRFIGMMPWFAFPAMPLAAWTLWLRRRQLTAPQVLLPLAFLGITLLLLAWAYRPREIPSLLLLPTLALLATPGALALRRGAASAFDWFAMTTFSLFALVVWIGWSAGVLGWPAKLAERTQILRPGFVGELNIVAVALALAASAWWLWLIVTAPRSPYRSLTHWTFGFTMLWLLATSLVLPWFDYGKTYRPVAQAIAQALPADHGCLAERGLSDTQLASLSYFVEIEPVAEDSKASQACNWLLVVGDTRRELAPPSSRWNKVWEGNRPGDRREKFRLYRR